MQNFIAFFRSNPSVLIAAITVVVIVVTSPKGKEWLTNILSFLKPKPPVDPVWNVGPVPTMEDAPTESDYRIQLFAYLDEIRDYAVAQKNQAAVDHANSLQTSLFTFIRPEESDVPLKSSSP